MPVQIFDLGFGQSHEQIIGQIQGGTTNYCPFWCGTGYEVIPIVSCDKLAIGDGKPGAITRKVQQRYFDVVYGRTADYTAWRLPIWSRQRAAAE